VITPPIEVSGLCWRYRSTISLSSCYYLSVHILLSLCPYTAISLSSYYYISVLILLSLCPHTTVWPHTTVCVRILLYMCSHAITYVSSGAEATRASRLRGPRLLIYTCPHTLTHTDTHTKNNVCWSLLYTCPHTALSSHKCPRTLTHTDTHTATCVLVAAIYVCSFTTLMCPHTLTHTLAHTTTYPLVAAILLHIRWSADIYVSSYYCIYVPRRLLTLLYICAGPPRSSPHDLFHFFHEKKLLHMLLHTCAGPPLATSPQITTHASVYYYVYAYGRICSTRYYCLYLLLLYSTTYASLNCYICSLTLL
jgi:hypothetical protein